MTMELNVLPITEEGVLTLSDEAWKQAHLRNEVIAPLSKQRIIGKQAADEAARQLSVSRRYIYKLVRHFRRGNGFVTDMAFGSPNGGKGKGRLSEDIETVIQNILQKRYLTRQKRSEVVIWREIIQSCRDLGLKRPALNTIRSRMRQLDPRTVTRKREGEHKKAIEKLKEQGKSQVGETSLFRMVAQMREITEGAARSTRKSRREAQRCSHLSKVKKNTILLTPSESAGPRY